MSAHNGQAVTVGSVAAGGVVSAGLDGGRVWVNCSQGTGLTAHINLDEAETFAKVVLDLVRQSRQAQR